MASYSKATICKTPLLTEKSWIFVLFQERLDFSCAMFGPDGGLVANAPHIPVHLGSMQETIQYQVMSSTFVF